MNMKSILFAASAALAVSLQAEVTANNTLCRIEVSSAAKSVIVAVPLVAVGTGSDVKVTDYIMTTNLKDGDSILKWNSSDSKWDGWVIKDGAWDAVTTVSDYSNVNTTKPADDSALARGAAVWLNRPSITAAESFYLYGQVSTGELTFKAAANSFTLIGNPIALAIPFTEAAKFFSGCHEGDTVYLSGEDGNMNYYVYKVPSKSTDNKATWCSVSTTSSNGFSKTTYTEIAYTVTLSAGAGFWYKNTGSTDVTVTISAEAQKQAK